MSDAGSRPIGIFDSGVGGFTVLRHMRRLLPGEDMVYFGDTARVPYGTKSPKTLTGFAIENVNFLLSHDVKLVVAACNSASAVALDELRRRFDVPIIGVVQPGASDAAMATSVGRVGVIGTRATIESGAYEKEIHAIDAGIEVFGQACPILVVLAEEGYIERDATRLIVEEYLSGLIERGIDVLILGCTHYPLFKSEIASVMGAEVALVDPGESTAKAVVSLMGELGLKSMSDADGTTSCYVSDMPEQVRDVAARFLGTAPSITLVSPP